MWRPEGLVNPYSDAVMLDKARDTVRLKDGSFMDRHFANEIKEVVERTWDAMLEEMRKSGVHRDVGQPFDAPPATKAGTWLFIPDEPTQH